MRETQEMMQRNAVNIQEGMDKTDNNSPNYGSKEMVQRWDGFLVQMSFSPKCSYQAKVTKLASKDLNTTLEQHGST